LESKVPDIQAKAKELIAKHSARTKHVKGMLKAQIQRAYLEGIEDCLHMMQEVALEDRMNEQLRDISAPLAVSPTHAAVVE
jgi:hypothetical protein